MIDESKRKAATVVCCFCQGSVDDAEEAKARHFAFACRKVPEAVKLQAKALAGQPPAPERRAG